MEQHGMDPDEYSPQELDALVGKKCLFKIYFSEYNVNYNNHTYRCDAFSENDEFINHFKKDFFEEEITEDVPDEVIFYIYHFNLFEPIHFIPIYNWVYIFVYYVPTQEFNTPATLIKKINMGDPSVSRVLDMQSPSGTLQSAGSSSGSGSKKSRVVDLESPDLDSSGSADKKRRVVVDPHAIYINFESIFPYILQEVPW